MPKLVKLPVSLSDEEMDAFENMCAEKNINSARKIGELIQSFLLAEGVKHQSRGE